MVIAHAEDDWEIPDSHSDVLFQAFLEPYLPDPLPLPTLGNVFSNEEWAELSERQQERKELRESIVKTTPIPKFGKVLEFTKEGRTVELVKTHIGSHDFVGLQEGLQDIIKRRFDF